MEFSFPVRKWRTDSSLDCKIFRPFDPGIRLLGIYPREITELWISSLHKDVQYSVVYRSPTIGGWFNELGYESLREESAAKESEVCKEFVIMWKKKMLIL